MHFPTKKWGKFFSPKKNQTGGGGVRGGFGKIPNFFRFFCWRPSLIVILSFLPILHSMVESTIIESIPLNVSIGLCVYPFPHSTNWNSIINCKKKSSYNPPLSPPQTSFQQMTQFVWQSQAWPASSVFSFPSQQLRVLTRAVESDFRKSNKSRMPKSF